MRPIYLISLLFLFCEGPTAEASSFSMCEYKLKILEVTKKAVKVDLIETIVSPGFNAENQTLACQGKINGGQIPLAKINVGKALAVKGEVVKAQWSTYSGMTPKGPTSSTSWKFYQLSK